MHHDGKLYYVANRILNCIDAATGKRLYQGRLSGASAARAEAPAAAEEGERRPPGGGRGRGGGGQDYSSPVIAGGKLYYVARNGETHVFKLGDTFQQLATNRVTDAVEDFSATPAFGGGAIFLRSNKHVYCVADDAATK
ncbi:MAG: hypothetical protein QM811_24430 [Pirellulales bacterium]